MHQISKLPNPSGTKLTTTLNWDIFTDQDQDSKADEDRVQGHLRVNEPFDTRELSKLNMEKIDITEIMDSKGMVPPVDG